MKHMYVIYDCNICEKFHILTAVWTADCEMDMKKWSLNMDSEIVASLESQIFQVFCKLHLANDYTNRRVMFSQVFEEGDKDEETTQAER